jgi:hypothetical protein
MLFQSVVPTYYNVFKNKSATQNELFYAVCLFDEMLEYCSQNIFNNAAHEILKLYLELINSSNCNKDIRYNIVYGFGVFA